MRSSPLLSCARAIEVLCYLDCSCFVLPPPPHRFAVQPPSLIILGDEGFRNQEFGTIYVIMTAIGYKLELMPHLSYS